MSRLPDGWVDCQFGDVTEIASGQVDPTEEPYIDLPHIAPDNIQSGTGRISNIQTARDLGITSGKYLFDEQAIVYSKIRPNLNKVCIPQFVGTCSADMYPIWANQNLDTFYLFQFMLTDSFVQEATKVSARTGLPKINRPDLQRIHIPLPPLPEQRKIADILSTWDEAIALVEALIDALKTRKQGLMQRLLTGEVRFPGFEGEWEEVRLGDVVETFSGGTPSRAQPEYYNGEIPWIKSGEINHVHITSTEETITEEGLKNSSAKIVESGTLLLALYGATAGKLGITHIPAAINQALLAILPHTGISKDYLFYELENRMGQILRKLQGGQPNLSAQLVKSSNISLPELSEQETISTFLQGLDDQIYGFDLYKHLLHEQKKGLMQRLLTGEVRVRVGE